MNGNGVKSKEATFWGHHMHKKPRDIKDDKTDAHLPKDAVSTRRVHVRTNSNCIRKQICLSKRSVSVQSSELKQIKFKKIITYNAP
jgi:hypothetical protein